MRWLPIGPALAAGTVLSGLWRLTAPAAVDPDLLAGLDPAHPGQGIGSWQPIDLARAMTLGVSPEGSHYYPAFPSPPASRPRRRTFPISCLPDDACRSRRADPDPADRFPP